MIAIICCVVFYILIGRHILDFLIEKLMEVFIFFIHCAIGGGICGSVGFLFSTDAAVVAFFIGCIGGGIWFFTKTSY